MVKSPQTPSRTVSNKFSQDKLIEFLRMKEPVLRAKQAEVARIILPFLIVNIFLFHMTFAAFDSEISNVSQSLLQISGIADLARPYLIAILALFSYFLLMKFGYLFYQGIKDALSVEELIDIAIPRTQNKNQTSDSMRESVYQILKSNYIIQSVVIFLGSSKYSNNIEVHGTLGGLGSLSKIVIKSIMIVMVFCFVYFIALSQILILNAAITFSAIIASIITASFIFYYVMFLILVTSRKPNIVEDGEVGGLRKFETKIMHVILVTMFILMILNSIASNLHLASNKNIIQSDPISTCKLSYLQGLDRSYFLFFTKFMFRSEDANEYKKKFELNEQKDVASRLNMVKLCGMVLEEGNKPSG